MVSLGPHGLLHLIKRASCTTRNCVYVGVHRKCEEEETFTCHFGETSQSLLVRAGQHKTIPCNACSPLKQIPVYHRRIELCRVIAGGVDPDEVLRDWFAHITDGGVHPGQQQISVMVNGYHCKLFPSEKQGAQPCWSAYVTKCRLPLFRIGTGLLKHLF